MQLEFVGSACLSGLTFIFSCNISSAYQLNYFLFIYCRDMDFTEKLDYSSAVALLGFSLIVSVLRSFSVKNEATRVLVAAPLLAFTTTHILYLNNYQMDYGNVIISPVKFTTKCASLDNKISSVFMEKQAPDT